MSYLNEKYKKQLVETFIKLVKIPSPSTQEGEFAKCIANDLKKLGCSVYFDNAGKKIGGNCGNLIAKLKGSINSKPILLCAHMDTVEPCKNIKPKVGGKIIKPAGKTILGGDCKAGIAIIMQTLRILKEQKLKHPPIEIVLTVAEELGMQGSKNLDYKKLKSKCGIILDNENVSSVDVKSPKAVIAEIEIKGKASHSGMAPEKGISAIKIASHAIERLKLGKIDSETVCNINMMQAGTAVNTIAPNAILKGDIRSHSIPKLNRQIKLLKNAFEKACKAYAKKIDGKMVTPKFKMKITTAMNRLKISENSLIIKHLKNAYKKNGVKLKLTSTASGSDANILCGYGILAPNTGCGTRKMHTTDEYLVLDEFYKCAEIVLDTVISFRD